MNDEHFMRFALTEAKKAFERDEVPVGACLVHDGKVIIQNHNRTREKQDPLAHAEKLVLTQAMEEGLKYLYDYTLYITLEPCLMCSGMIILSKVGRVVYGAKDPKSGVAGSLLNVLADKNFNHRPEIRRGVLKEECALVLTDFFAGKR